MKLRTQKAAATLLSALCLLAFSPDRPSMAAAGLPAGIVALSDGKLALPEAEKFCRQQGGRLPLVGNADFLEGYTLYERVTVDGFSHIGAAWPDGLSDELFFWTGTKGAKDNPDLVYLINSGAALVRAEIFYEVNYRELTAFAACVPLTE